MKSAFHPRKFKNHSKPALIPDSSLLFSMTIQVQYSPKDSVILDFAQGLRRTEAYACQPDLAAATDLLLEALAQANAESWKDTVLDCLRELESEADTAGLDQLRQWVVALVSLWIRLSIIWDLGGTEPDGPHAFL